MYITSPLPIGSAEARRGGDREPGRGDAGQKNMCQIACSFLPCLFGPPLSARPSHIGSPYIVERSDDRPRGFSKLVKFGTMALSARSRAAAWRQRRDASAPFPAGEFSDEHFIPWNRLFDKYYNMILAAWVNLRRHSWRWPLLRQLRRRGMWRMSACSRSRSVRSVPIGEPLPPPTPACRQICRTIADWRTAPAGAAVRPHTCRR